MRKYEVKVEEIKTSYFQVAAESKDEVEMRVNEIISKTQLLHMDVVSGKTFYKIIFKRIKK